MTAAAGMTYDSLVADIQVYAERSDAPFIDQVPRFIMMAENRLASEVRGLGFQKYATFTLSTSTFAKPERWRETISLNARTTGDRVFLQKRDYDYCRTFTPDATVTGVPRYYADYEYEHVLVVPTPDATYNMEMAYYERPAPLSSTNQTNWTTQYAPQLILYASLLEAQPFLKRPERTQEFQALYDRALQGIGIESQRRTSDRAAAKGTSE
jgi:hypothetical protein